MLHPFYFVAPLLTSHKCPPSFEMIDVSMMAVITFSVCQRSMVAIETDAFSLFTARFQEGFLSGLTGSCGPSTANIDARVPLYFCYSVALRRR